MTPPIIKKLIVKLETSTPLFIALLAAGAAIRLIYCALPPLYTTDLLRNLGYGKAFPVWGFRLYDLTPSDLTPSPMQYLWPNHNFPYPAVTLLFYALIACLHSSLFFGKLALTLIDAVNARLIFKISQDRILAALYWFNPINIWFGSREGQFEPFVILLMLLALRELQKGRSRAYFYLGLAVQAKLFPIFLAPYFLSRLSWRELGRCVRVAVWGAASLVPSLAAACTSGYMAYFFRPGYIPAYNPITWNLGDPSLYPFFPFSLVLAHGIAGFAFVLFCLYGLRRTRQLMQWLAPLVFVFFVKFNRIGQFWYLMLTPAFCLTVEEPSCRRWLFLFSAALGVRSLYSILIGPIGYYNPPDAQYLNILCFWGF
ncbi:MAG: glycosyltransferase 87 family protein [Candidatus Omnitrophota bacterium]